MKKPKPARNPIVLHVGKLELCDRVACLRRNLAGKPESEHDKLDALEQIALNLDILVDRALRGDELIGDFLAVLAVYFDKHKARLGQANNAFRMSYAKRTSARHATKRSKGLREKIEQMMFEAKRVKQAEEIAKRLVKDTSMNRQNDSVMKLPRPDHRSKAVISTWSDYICSALLKVDLEKEPGIGDQTRYKDKNGKFQTSRVRKTVPSIVKRIFRVWDAESFP